MGKVRSGTHLRVGVPVPFPVPVPVPVPSAARRKALINWGSGGNLSGSSAT